VFRLLPLEPRAALCVTNATPYDSYKTKALTGKNKRYTTNAITINTRNPLDPWFVTGFTDGEGCFTLFLTNNSNLSIGWQVRVSFEISLHKKDLILLEEIQSYFGGAGVISSNTSRDSVIYKIQSLEQILNVILPHFDKYRLITQKGADYLLFREVVRMMQVKQHLTFVRSVV